MIKIIKNKTILKIGSWATLVVAIYFWLKIETRNPIGEHNSEKCTWKPSACTYEIGTNWFMFALSMLFLIVTLTIWGYLTFKAIKQMKQTE